MRPATPLICAVHRRAQGHLRGRTDLPGTGRARRADRPAHLLGAPLGGAVETGAVGHHDHRNPGRQLRTRRRRETPAGEPVRQPEDVGAPAAPGHPGGAAHGGTDHAAQRLARGDPRSPRTAHHRTGSDRCPGAGPGGPAVAGLAPNLLGHDLGDEKRWRIRNVSARITRTVFPGCTYWATACASLARPDPFSPSSSIQSRSRQHRSTC